MVLWRMNWCSPFPSPVPSPFPFILILILILIILILIILILILIILILILILILIVIVIVVVIIISSTSTLQHCSSEGPLCSILIICFDDGPLQEPILRHRGETRAATTQTPCWLEPKGLCCPLL